MIIPATNDKEVHKVTTVLKALLMGFTIDIDNESYRYFNKGDVTHEDETHEYVATEGGVFRQYITIADEPVEYTYIIWLFYTGSIANFIELAESMSDKEFAHLCAALALTKDARRNPHV